MNNGELNRIEWVDQLKAICMALVVFTHCHGKLQNIPLEFQSLFFSIDRCGVPIFFMLSGAFIIPRANTDRILDFYKKRLPRFIIAIFLCCVLTNFTYSILYDSIPISNAFIYALIKENGIWTSWGHAVQIWFMYPLILIYIMAPFLAKMIVNLKTRNLVFLLAVCLFFGQFQSLLHEIGYSAKILSAYGDNFLSPYISYFIIGYLIFDRFPKNNQAIAVACFCLMVTIIYIVYLYDMSDSRLSHNLHWYSSSVPIYVTSICMIIFIRYFLEKYPMGMLNNIGKNAFGIYLLHNALLLAVLAITKKWHLTSWYENVLLLFLVGFLGSYLISIMLSKSRYCRYITK